MEKVIQMVVTIAIPAYNSEKTIYESIKSAMKQNIFFNTYSIVPYDGIEILVVDNNSTDNTIRMAEAADNILRSRVRIVKNDKNLGIGGNLERCMKLAKGKIVVYLCADDIFTNDYVVSDIITKFKEDPRVGVIGHYFYQFLDNASHIPIMVSRDEDIVQSSCNPSGMAFRKDKYKFTNDIFIEMPYVVKQAIDKWDYAFIKYDSIAVRVGSGINTANKEEYYQGSMYENWFKVLGRPLSFPEGLIQIKCNAPKNLWREICSSIRINRWVLTSVSFWFYSLIAILIPSSCLKKLSNFYRKNMAKHMIEIIRREDAR
jgi:glycosyltransferase involved in cell wall biosynthesis